MVYFNLPIAGGSATTFPVFMSFEVLTWTWFGDTSLNGKFWFFTQLCWMFFSWWNLTNFKWQWAWDSIRSVAIIRPISFQRFQTPSFSSCALPLLQGSQRKNSKGTTFSPHTLLNHPCSRVGGFFRTSSVTVEHVYYNATWTSFRVHVTAYSTLQQWRYSHIVFTETNSNS